MTVKSRRWEEVPYDQVRRLWRESAAKFKRFAEAGDEDAARACKALADLAWVELQRRDEMAAELL